MGEKAGGERGRDRGRGERKREREEGGDAKFLPRDTMHMFANNTEYYYYYVSNSESSSSHLSVFSFSQVVSPTQLSPTRISSPC